MQVRFNLKSKKTEVALIVLKFRYQPGQLPFVFSTRQHVPVKYWNTDNNRVSQTRKYPQYRELNIFLDLLENEVLNIYRKTINARQTVTNEILRNGLLEYLQVKPAAERIRQQEDFLSYYLDWIETKTAIRAPGTIKHHKKTCRRVRTYCNTTGVPTEMHRMGLSWWSGLIEHCVQKNYHPNTIAKLLSTLKTVLHEAEDEGYKINAAYKSKRVRFKKIPPAITSLNKVYLTLEEIETLRDYDLTHYPELVRTRDVAVVGLRTGLACTDFSSLTLNNIRKVRDISVIDKNRQKSQNKSLIPVHPDVFKILKKYAGFPPPYTNQTLNKNLKSLCRIIGLTTPVIFTHYEGRNQRQQKYYKYELIGTHTFRRSFITNLILEGVPDHAIMQMTGITKKDTLETYNCLRPEESLIIGSRADFFKQNALKVVA